MCSDCEGEESVFVEGIRDHAYSAEEFFQEYPSPDDRAEYFKRGGIYDEVCQTCKGRNVELAIDENIAALGLHALHWQRFVAQEKERREFERENAAERAMGA